MRSPTSFPVLVLLILFVSVGSTVIVENGPDRPLASFPSFTYLHGNDTFNVSGPAVFIPGRLIPDNMIVADSIIIVDYIVQPLIHLWAGQCQAKHCLGVVMWNLDRMWDFVAWRYVTFSTVPCVVIAQHDPLPIGELADRVINMNSADAQGASSPTQQLVDNSLVSTWFFLCWFVNVVVVVLALYKAATFLFDLEGNLRPLELFPFLVFIFQISASGIRGCWFLDAFFFHWVGLSPRFYRYSSSGHVPFAMSSILVVSLAMHSLAEAGHAVSRIHTMTVAGIVSFCVCALIGDELQIIISTVTLSDDQFNNTIPGVIYFFLNMPIALTNIFFARQISKSLSLDSNPNIPRFIGLVALSAVIGIVLVCLLILYSFIEGIVSPFHILFTSLVLFLETLQGFLSVSAFVQNRSIARSYLVAVCNRPRRVPGSVRTDSKIVQKPKNVVVSAPV